MLNKLRPYLEPPMSIVAKPISFLHPNIITIVGLVPPMMFAYFLYTESYHWALISIILSTIDFLDGTIARLTDKTSKFGGILDASFDRVADGLYISAFGFASLVSWFLVIPTLVLTLLISYIKAKTEASTEVTSVGTNQHSIGIMQRAERLVILGVSVILLNLNIKPNIYNLNTTEIVFIVLLILSFITVIQRLYSSYKILNAQQ